MFAVSLVELSVSDAGIATLTLKNEKKLNALSIDFVDEIYSALLNLEKKAKVLIVTGGERAFAAGVDIREIEKRNYEHAYTESFIDKKWEAIWDVKIPVIAAVSGYALGAGFEICLMSDIIIATRTAKFGFPEINLGLLPGMGGTQLLPRLVGTKIAMKLLLTADMISAEEACELGIVANVVEPQNLLSEAHKLAEKIASKSTMSTRLIKELVRTSQNAVLSTGMQIERNTFRSLFSTSFKEEGVRNFLKR